MVQILGRSICVFGKWWHWPPKQRKFLNLDNWVSYVIVDIIQLVWFDSTHWESAKARVLKFSVMLRFPLKTVWDLVFICLSFFFLSFTCLDEEKHDYYFNKNHKGKMKGKWGIIQKMSKQWNYVFSLFQWAVILKNKHNLAAK